jgi:tripartite-type tricarboxylate transporter receptor subunit TctC
LPRIAQVQAYPSRPVRIIEGFGAGSALDIVARLIGQSLSEQLGQSFVIENRTGASSNIAAEAVARASPDDSLLAADQAVPSRNTITFSNRAICSGTCL